MQKIVRKRLCIKRYWTRKKNWKSVAIKCRTTSVEEARRQKLIWLGTKHVSSRRNWHNGKKDGFSKTKRTKKKSILS